MENKIIKTLRIHYFAMLAVVCAMIAFLELRFEEKLTFALPDAMYITQVFVIMFTLIFISVAIIGFTKSLEKAKGLSKEDAMVLFLRKGMQRTNLLFCVLAVNAMAYCIIGYEGALYCGLVALGAMIYSFPTKRVLDEFLIDKE